MDNFLAVNVVGVVDLNYSYVRVGYLTEVLVALLCVENRYGNCNLLDLRRDLREVDDDSLVVAVALAGAVVAGVDYRAISAVEIVIEYKILVAENLAVCSQKEHARVKVEIAAAVVLVIGVLVEVDELLRVSYLMTLCHGVFQWKPASSEWPARLPPHVADDRDLAHVHGIQACGNEQQQSDEARNEADAGPLTLLDSATPVTAALKSSRMMEMTNQIMRVPFGR